ncbi:TonB-dependent siderophore receptor [Altererythrobacter luteolus]|uniref:TonB-dependent siderophore receptor n=2 Tax=Pontixanthobacter luteolus TaxID=295089 RepID=A0A6I4V2Y8_9SPHN|nr:TonB-dependent siderophore receptor [Pontixanthobacter luteolus]
MLFNLRHVSLLSTVAAAAMATPAFASEGEDLDRDYLPVDIVVTGAGGGYKTDDGSTGTKTPTPLIEVPQTIVVITEDQLDDQAITQLGDALRFVPGVSLETGEGHRDEVFIRGQESTADFYLDGLRDDAQYYRSLYNVSRIEVLKGANALIFGRGGGGGVVNRVSKIADPMDMFLAADAQVDTFGAFAVSADVNQPLSDNVAARINATYEEFGNDRQFYEGRFIGISPTITADLSPETRLTAHYTYDNDERVTDRGVPSLNGKPLTGFDQTFFGVPGFNEASAEVHIARARVDHEFSSALSANASVQYANYDKVYSNILPRGTDGTTVSLGGYKDFTKRENFVGQANLVWNVDTGPLSHTFLAGIEALDQDTSNGRFGISLSEDEVDLQELIDFPTVTLTPLTRNRESQLNVLSGYIQDQIEIGEYVELIAGLRWERFDLETLNLVSGQQVDRVDEMVSPRFGIVLKPSGSLSFYASYSESFLPQSGDQFLSLSAGDAAFDPEKFSNYEIGAKWLVKPDLFFTASVFRLDRTNTTAPDPANTGLTVQIGESRVEGAELSLVGDILPGWSASLGYTYLDGEIRTTSDFAVAGTRLQQLPKHQISAWNHIDVTDRFGIGLGAIHQSQQFSSFSNEVVLPSYWRFDAAAYFELNDRVSLQVNVENLFDENYYASAHGDNNIQPGDPLSARFGVRIKM